MTVFNEAGRVFRDFDISQLSDDDQVVAKSVRRRLKGLEKSRSNLNVVQEECDHPASACYHDSHNHRFQCGICGYSRTTRIISRR